MKVKKGEFAKYRKSIAKILDVSPSKKQAYIGIVVTTKSLHKIRRVI